MTLRSVLEQAKEGIKDLSSLEVQTYTGEISVDVNSIGSTNFDEILNTAKVTGNIKLAQVTKINIDGDAINLVPDTKPPAHVAAAHQTALIAGQNVRVSILELFKNLIDND